MRSDALLLTQRIISYVKIQGGLKRKYKFILNTLKALYVHVSVKKNLTFPNTINMCAEQFSSDSELPIKQPVEKKQSLNFSYYYNEQP